MIERLIRKLHQQGLLGNLLEILRRLGLLAVAFRIYEHLSALNFLPKKDLPALAASSDGPLPPPELMILVAGTPRVDWFIDFGHAMFQMIVALLRQHDAPVENMQAILEFGCGCGRVLRYWASVRGPAIYGTDYNAKLIAWCRQNLPFARTGINHSDPPLSYADQSFDCIYAISVFTHLAEETQIAWMRELARVLKPGGHLLITIHGESYRDRMKPFELAVFEAGQLVVRYEETSGTNLCTAYHPDAYVRNQLAFGYSVCDFVPAGRYAAIYQDTYLLRKT